MVRYIIRRELMYKIITDLEMCTNHKKNSFFNHEIIQIGAVAINEKGDFCGEFNTYVKPQFIKISSIIKKITGISNSMVKDSPCFEDALEDFLNWMDNFGGAVVYSWSNTDLLQIHKEAFVKKLITPRLMEYIYDWVDFQRSFCFAVKSENQIALSSALEMMSADVCGHMHSALDDARNTAILITKAKKKFGDELKIRPICSYFKLPEKYPRKSSAMKSTKHAKNSVVSF